MQSLQDALSHFVQLALCCWKAPGVGIVERRAVFVCYAGFSVDGNPADSGFNRFELAVLALWIVHPREVWHSVCPWRTLTSLMASVRSADDELRTGVPLRGVMSASPLRPCTQMQGWGAPPEGQLSGGGFFEEVRSQSPHLSNLLHVGVVNSHPRTLKAR